MIVSPVTSSISTAQAGGKQAAANLSTPSLDGSEFMQIMLAQLRHQNPLEPMDDNEMISQMAQLNSLQELQQINAALQILVGATQTGAAGGGGEQA